MTKPTAPSPQQVDPAQDLFDKAKALVQAMVNVEQDPDLISVFMIAKAHGYKVTSRFWHEPLNVLAQSLVAFESAQKAKAKAEAEKKAPLADVVPFESPSSPTLGEPKEDPVLEDDDSQ